MEYQRINCHSYNIHTIKTDKFKTIRMELTFTREVKEEEMPIFAFLSDYLSDCSLKYQRRKNMEIRLEELYKTIFYSTTNKVGNMFSITFVLEFIDPKFINDFNYIEEVLSFPFEVINNPFTLNKEFDLTNFNIIKRSMTEEIESINESSERLAILNALKTMDNTSPSSFRVLGTIDSLNKITPSNLYDAYEDLFKNSLCDIFLVGNVNNHMIDIIKKKFKNHSIKTNKINLLVNNKSRNKVLIKNSESNFVQSTLVMIYNINNLEKKEKNIDFHVYNYLLGASGLNSKLYKNLRTDNSLCYGVRSLYLKYDELLIISVSLDDKNINKAEDLIKKSIKEMNDGKFSDEDVKSAIKNLSFSLNLGLDTNTSIINNYVFNYFDNLPLIDERINMLNEVKREDIIKCGKSLKLNTIYIQKAGEPNGRN